MIVNQYLKIRKNPPISNSKFEKKCALYTGRYGTRYLY